MELLREYPNVVVLRTFSKAYGLAGLRVGYAIADPPSPLPCTPPPRRSASSFGREAAACAALTDAGHTDRIVESCGTGGRHLRSGLADRGIRTPTSGGNFVWTRSETAQRNSKRPASRTGCPCRLRDRGRDA
ncbi:aminotransferase class I/II-fold pyridoxal phosphate-dependent enzyme [Rhodococcus hoagii]|nr:aminotransferase class I/II-fold pyridoxal phosphate-dependent enzyme [Prescottella equi]